MVVEEINLLTTVFLRDDNQKIIYPNSTLATKAIGNYYRSPDMGDAVEFCVHISTPAEKIAAMKHKITRQVKTSKFSRILFSFMSLLKHLFRGMIATVEIYQEK